MSSIDRLRVDKNNRVFVPMNVEGGVDDGFFTPLKLVTAIIMAIVVIYEAMLISDGALKPAGIFMYIFVTLIIFFYIIRFIMMDERYFYRMYKKLQVYNNPTPSVFWDIVDIYDTDEGSIIIYSDIKLGVMIKMEKDTIIGRDEEFRQTHYDAISEFFKELNLRELPYVQMNIMEHADNDPRLQILDDVAMKCSNKNISKVLEMQTGYLKTMARKTLYESEYYLIYTPRSNRLDTMLGDIYECLYKLMDGAYSGFEILKKEDIHDLCMKQNGVRYFDLKAATLEVFSRTGAVIKPTFKVKELTFTDGEVIPVKEKENMALSRVSSMKKQGKIAFGEVSLRDAFKGNGVYKLNAENNVYRKPTESNVIINKQVKDGNEIVHTVDWDDNNADDIFFTDSENVSVEEEIGLANSVEDAAKVASGNKVKEKKKLFGRKK